MTYGTISTADGRPAVRFERRLSHAIERVWEAVTTPEGLAHWFPARVELLGELRPGTALRFVFPDGGVESSGGEIVEVDPPRLFAFTWDEDVIRLELAPLGDGGCVLVLTNVLDGSYPAPSVAAGWHVCLDELGKHLGGEPASAPGTTPTPRHEELRAEYESGANVRR